MKLAVFAFSLQGLQTAKRVCLALNGEGNDLLVYAPERLAGGEVRRVTPPLADFTAPLFREMDALVFVSSCGIAVRAVAPHVRDKATDPAVIAVDETAQFVVPLLSGHIGGANRLARHLAVALGATGVVTTATDANGKFSVDAWAVEKGLYIDSLKAAKAVSAAILEGPVPLKSDFPIAGELPPGVVPGESGPVGICVSWRRQAPFEKTLLLVPKVVRLGIGCRRGTSWAVIHALVEQVLEENNVPPEAVKSAASIDLKKNEPGLLACCQRWGWPLKFYTAGQLKAVEGDFIPSDFVKKTTGVDNVCERAALAGGGELIIRKTAGHGVTVAAAAEHWEVTFS